jgi:hypothetical protein
MPSKKKRSPRLEIRILDNQIGRYPTVARTGDSNRTGAGSIFYDDTDTYVYTQLSDSSSVGSQFVSMPTSIPSGSKYLLGNLTSSIFVSGNAIRDVEQWISPVIARQFETIKPYIESSQYEQDLKTTEFYKTGSSLEEFGLGFLSKLDSKTKISIDIPVATPVQLQPRSASIYYLNSERGRFEEIAAGLRHRPWANINFWETRLFNHLGSNILSSSKNDVLQLGHILNTPTENQTLPRSYLQDNLPTAFSNMGRLLSLVNTQSALIDSNFEATSSQYIQMSRFISQPFMVEKVIMEIPIKAGPGWLRDYTRFVRLSAINGYRNDPFDTGGPAVTFGLINQINRNNRDLILSATIIPENDNFIGQDVSPLYNERFASGFKSYGQPALVIPSSSNQTFTGTLKFQLEPRISNGVTSLGFFCVSGSYSLYGSNRGDKLRNSFAISVNPFGRSMRGVAAGRSVFGKEFSVPDGDGVSALARFFPEGIGSYCDVYLYNYQQNAISPYILFPSDKLVLSVSKYRACVSQSAVNGTVPFNFNGGMNLNQAHDIWMDSGTIKITMYGSMVREGSEYHDSLNSRLDTNSVHESIHNVIVDEWDVGSVQEFTGSMRAQHMSGTATPFLNHQEYQWSRQRQIDSTDFDPRNTFSSIFASEQPVQYWERVQFFRNIQVTSDNEQYYDSMLPRFDEIFRKERSGAPYNAIVGSGDMLITLDFIDSVTRGFSVVDWSRSFPFEPKYSDLVRTKAIEKVASRYNTSGFFANPGTARLSLLSPTDTKIAIEVYRVPFDGEPFDSGGNYYHIWADSINGNFAGLKYTDLIKILYASGDYNNVRSGTTGVHGSDESPGQFYGSTCRPFFRTKTFDVGAPNYGYLNQVYRGALIRGWKYGLLNGFETQTKAVFRRDRYGHLRDMLEQRNDSKFHDGLSVLPSPVNVKFIGPNGSTVKPENTFSSNLSFEATSSLPYFDGTVRNREEPLYVPSIYSAKFTR